MTTKARDQRLAELGLTYPIWVFDVDQFAWPRKLDEIGTESFPATLTGWYPWNWEFGTTIRRIDDSLPLGVIDTSLPDRTDVAAVASILDRLRYDDTFPSDTFTVQCVSSSTTTELQDVLNGQRSIAAKSISRIIRKWDDVPFLCCKQKVNLFEKPIVCYGVATRVHNDEEFVRAAGAQGDHNVSKIRKAEFSITTPENEEEIVRGVVFPSRSHPERGLYLDHGLKSADNQRLLYGTALEGAPWSDVEDYVLSRRKSPLW